MAYATAAQFENRFPLINKKADANRDNIYDSGIITQILDDSSSEVNRYLSARWRVPLTLSNSTTAGMIRDITLTIAAYKVSLRCPPVEDDVKQAYDVAIEWLKDVAKGNIDLPGETPGDDSVVAPITIMKGRGTRRATYDKLTGI